LDLKPTILSILVGVNDFNVSFTATGKGDPERYEREYRELLTRTRDAIPNIRFVICEPYALTGAREKIDAWYPEFDIYRDIARKMAVEFQAVFIPFQQVYKNVISVDTPSKYYSSDGIHPSLAGIEVMSEGWIEYSQVQDNK
jgi:lysophospholipase L1-like esterase